jgi:hypothetical protein
MLADERSSLDLLALVASFDAESTRFWQNTHRPDGSSSADDMSGRLEGGMLASDSATQRQVRRHFVFSQLQLRDDVQMYTGQAATEGCRDIRHYFDTTSRSVVTCDQVVEIVKSTLHHFHRLGIQCRDQTSEFGGVLMYSERHTQYFPLLTQKGRPYELLLHDLTYRQGVISFHTHCDFSLIDCAVQYADLTRGSDISADVNGDTSKSMDLRDKYLRARDLTAIPTSADFISVFLRTCSSRVCEVDVLLSHHGVTVYAPNSALTRYAVGIVSWEEASKDFMNGFLDRITEAIARSHSDLLFACLGTPDSTHPTILPMFVANLVDFLDITKIGDQMYGFDCVFLPFEQKDPYVYQMFTDMN